ncbi:Tubulin polyglutamylase ttll6 [Phlyctochytrium planicorne]|nr:Tubulin polyglutamylase ttll6 [Phlyctochytrium planicorne]
MPSAMVLKEALMSERTWRTSDTTLVDEDISDAPSKEPAKKVGRAGAKRSSYEGYGEEKRIRTPVTRAVVKKKTGAKPQAVRINTTNCKYDIVRACSKKCGFKVVEDMETWSLFWIDTGVSVQRVLEMEPYQKINHFPGMHEICRKDHLARNLSRLSRLLPKEYNFFPKTWILPLEWEDLKLTIKGKKGQTFIAKPDHGCQGKGIFLFRNLKSISAQKGSNLIVQSYLPKPYLIDNLKFDLRVYVLVTSVDPLRIFIHKSGLARFATHRYSDPSEGNMSDVCMHLTNYAINKHSNSFIRGDDENRGSKRTLASVLKLIEDKGKVTSQELWERMEDVIIKTVLTIQPQLGMILRACFPSNASNKMGKNRGSQSDERKTPKPRGVESQCFEILGFDIFLDKQLKPWVLEVNHSPSFTCDSPIDVKVKEAVIVDTMKMLDFSLADKKRFLKEEKERQKARLFGGKENAEPKDLDQNVKSSQSKEPSVSTPPKELPLSISGMPILEEQPRPSKPAFNDTLDITRPNTTSRNSTAEEPARAISAPTLDLISQYLMQYPAAYLTSLKSYEDSRMGSFVRAFPPEDPGKLAKYLKCLASSRKLFSDTKTTQRRREFLQRQQEDKIRSMKRRSEAKEKEKEKDAGVRPRYMDWSQKPKGKREEEIQQPDHSPDEDPFGNAYDDGNGFPESSFSHFYIPPDPNSEKLPLKVNVESLNDRMERSQELRHYPSADSLLPSNVLRYRTTVPDGVNKTPTYGASSSNKNTPMSKRGSSNGTTGRPISAPRIMSEREARAIRMTLARKRRQRLDEHSLTATPMDTFVLGQSTISDNFPDQTTLTNQSSDLVDELLRLPSSSRGSRTSSAKTIRSHEFRGGATGIVPSRDERVEMKLKKSLPMAFPYTSVRQPVSSFGRIHGNGLHKSLMISKFRPKAGVAVSHSAFYVNKF